MKFQKKVLNYVLSILSQRNLDICSCRRLACLCAFHFALCANSLLLVPGCSDKTAKDSVKEEPVEMCAEHGLPEKECTLCNPSLTGLVTISTGSQALSGIKIEKVRYREIQNKIDAVGKVTYNQKKLSYINSRISGRIEECFVFLQSRVDQGQVLISLYSPEYLTAQSEYLQAIERVKRVKLTSNTEEERQAVSIYESAGNKLLILGISNEEISRLEETSEVQQRLNIRAPFSGTIIESNVIQGNYAAAGDNLYKLADLSSLWINADIYERDIETIKIGQTVEITTPIYPDKIFIGQITVIGDILDEKSRTFKVRIELKDTGSRLKPEMFVKAAIIADKRNVIAIPKKAVLIDSEKRIVFTSITSMENNTFCKKEVELGKETGDLVEIVKGLKSGEQIVTEGSFLVKSELLKAKIGASCAE